ncbi:MAG: hypothetical protein V4735_02865 [Pseudomonadota bacterium]
MGSRKRHLPGEKKAPQPIAKPASAQSILAQGPMGTKQMLEQITGIKWQSVGREEYESIGFSTVDEARAFKYKYFPDTQTGAEAILEEGWSETTILLAPVYIMQWKLAEFENEHARVPGLLELLAQQKALQEQAAKAPFQARAR